MRVANAGGYLRVLQRTTTTGIFISTKTGVINLAADKAKSKYLRDITDIMNSFDIPVMLWDYNDKFTILKNDTNKQYGNSFAIRRGEQSI